MKIFFAAAPHGQAETISERREEMQREHMI